MRNSSFAHAALALLLLVPATSSLGSDRPLLISEVTIISPERDEPLESAHLLVRNGRIEQISTAPIDAQNARIIDGKGHYLTPGLIDSHVHLGSYGGIRGDQIDAHRGKLEAFWKQESRSYLYYGFTTVVDLNQSEEFAAGWSNHRHAPKLVYCKALPFPNGYSVAFLPEEHRYDSPFLLYDPEQSEIIPDSVVPAEHTPEAVVEKVRATNASCVKTFFESGFAGLWDWPTPPDSLIANVARLAGDDLVHFHHANSLEGYAQAAETGVEVLAHGLWNWSEYNASREMPGEIRAILDQLIANGTAMQPTAQVLESELRLFSTSFLDDPRLPQVLPEAMLDWYRTDDAKWFERRLRENQKNLDVVRTFLGREPSGDDGETSEVALSRLQQVVRYFKNHGGTIVLGSDTPSSPTYTNPPGLNGFLELSALERIGLSPSEVLRASTLDNAVVLGLENDLGTVEVGKVANLILLEADPLESTAAFDTISHVILRGEPIPRASLSAIKN